MLVCLGAIEKLLLGLIPLQCISCMQLQEVVSNNVRLFALRALLKEKTLSYYPALILIDTANGPTKLLRSW